MTGVQALLQQADQAMALRQFPEAGALIERALDLEPRNAPALNAAAKLTCALGHLDHAENYARRACQEQLIPDHVAMLATVLKWKQDYNGARKYYRLVLDQVPLHYDSLFGLADLYFLTGYWSLAAQCFETIFAQDGFHPWALFAKYAKLFKYDRAPYMLAMLRTLVPRAESAPPEEYLRYQMEYVVRHEDAARAARGQSQLALSAEELFFPSSQQERDAAEAKVDVVLARRPDHIFANEAKVFCLVARGERRKAVGFVETLTRLTPSAIWPSVILDDAFYQGLEKQDDAALFGMFPDIVDITPQTFADAPVLFLSCDYHYFTQFARVFLASINAVHPHAQVHMHVLDPLEDKIEEIAAYCAGLANIKVAVSIERAPTPTRIYYHAIRFIRQYQLLQRYQAPVWVFDVDAVLNRDLKSVMDIAARVDFATTAHAGAWQPWNQFRAMFVAVNFTERGLAFARLVAAYIADCHAKDRSRWGIDQAALYGAYAFLKDQGRGPTLELFGDKLIDVEYRDDGIIWVDGGVKKFMPLAEMAEEATPLDSPLVRYRTAVEKYAR